MSIGMQSPKYKVKCGSRDKIELLWGTKFDLSDCPCIAHVLKSYCLWATMSEQVIEDYVTYHVDSNDHHAPEEEVGTDGIII